MEKSEKVVEMVDRNEVCISFNIMLMIVPLVRPYTFMYDINNP